MAAVGKRSALVAAIADSASVHKRIRPEKSATPEREMPEEKQPGKFLANDKNTPNKLPLVGKPTPEKVPMASHQQLKVCGPEYIQTLRGHLLGREVAIILCGEAHNSALDLTRQQGIMVPVRDWLEVPRSEAPSYHPMDAFKTVRGLSLEKAKAWAHHEMEFELDESQDNGGVLLYQPMEGLTLSTAQYFAIETRPRKWIDQECRECTFSAMPENAVMYQWIDQDPDVRADFKRQVAGKDFRQTVHDAAMSKRKQLRRGEGLELFDDWLVRQYQETTSKKDNAIRVDFVYEGQVAASELELHVEPGVPKAPPAHDCLKAIELDSDEEALEDCRPDDGEGGFADYLTRRVEQHLAPGNIHGIDPRNMGQDPSKSQKAMHKKWNLGKRVPKDTEEVELTKSGAAYPQWYIDKYPKAWDNPRTKTRLPSWELFFGQAAEYLYYSGNVKTDYAPFLATCLPTTERLLNFFDELYFGTVPQAIAHLGHLDDNARSLTRIKSLAHIGPERVLSRRPTDDGLTNLKAAPIDRYLKARGSQPPRTWVSGLAATLRAAGGEQFLEGVQSWYRKCVMKLLANPKHVDRSGDYFNAWLRETRPDIYKEIDPCDASALRRANYVPSLDIPNRKKRGHYIGNIQVPSLDQALAELRQFKSEDRVATTKRQRVMAKIIVDVMQLRLVDVAAILKVATIAASSPVGSRHAIVFYGGADHTSSLITFFKSQGFSHKGLSREGLVDGRARKSSESCGLKLPAYLHDFELLFPVP